MAQCGRCGKEKKWVSDSSSGGVYSTCACDIPLAPAIPIPSVTKGSSKRYKAKKQKSYSPANIPVAGTTKPIANQPSKTKVPAANNQYYNCLICKKTISENHRSQHVQVCFIQVPPVRFVCQYCKQTLTSTSIKTHASQCLGLATVCPVCSLSLSRLNLVQHLVDCQPLAPFFRSGEFFRCNICGGAIVSTARNSHRASCRRTLLNNGSANQPIQNEVNHMDMMLKKAVDDVCPYCKTQVKINEFKAHGAICQSRFQLVKNFQPAMSKQTNNSPVSKKKNKKSSYSGSLSFEESRPDRPGSYQDLGGSEDRMDATRGMGHFAREHGRIGSSPIHDDYDN